MFTRRKRRYTIRDIVSAQQVDSDNDWLVEALKIYALTFALNINPVNLVDPFEIFIHAGYIDHWRRSDANIIQDRLNLKTYRPYKNISQAFKDLYDSLIRVTQDEIGDPIIHILNENGSLEPLSSIHKPLLESRKNVLGYVSGTIKIVTFVEYDEDRFRNGIEDDTFKNRLKSVITPYRQAGSVVIRFPNANTRPETEHITSPVGFGYFNRCETIEFHHAFVELFNFLTERETLFSTITSPQINDLQNAIKCLLDAMHNPVPMESLTSSLDFVVEMIEQYDRSTAFAYGVRWDLFGEALLSYCGGNPLPEQTTLKLRECIVLSTDMESFSRLRGCLLLRNFDWKAKSWLHSKFLQDANTLLTSNAPQIKPIIAQINSGQITGKYVVDTLLAQCNSMQDPSDAFWVAAKIALQLGKNDPQLCVQVNTFAMLHTNSHNVSRRSQYPKQDEWFRRICGGDTESPGAYEKTFQDGAKIMSDITNVARQRALDPTTTSELLDNRSLDESPFDGANLPAGANEFQSSRDALSL